MGYSGPGSTWTRGNIARTFTRARLDRALCNTEWRTRFDNASVHHLPKQSSDHTPILVRLCRSPQNPPQFSFCFQTAWLSHLNLIKVVESNWNTDFSLTSNNKQLAAALMQWNKESFGNIFKKKMRLWARLEGVKNILATNYSNGLLKLEKKLQQELALVVNQEELLWYQRSREDWIKSGDRNT